MESPLIQETLPLEDAPDELRKNLEEKSYYLSERVERVEFAGTSMTVSLRGAGLTAAERARLRAELEELVRSTTSSFDKVSAKTLYERIPAIAGAAADPHDHLARTGQLTRILDGVPAMSGSLLRLIHGIDREIRKLARGLGCEEHEYGTTLPLSSLVDNGYLRNFPQHIMLAGPFHPTLETIQKVSAGDSGPFRERMAEPAQVLSPTVCHHTFDELRNRRLETLPARITARAKCHRFEYKGTRGLERLQTFTMREIVSFDPAEGIDALRNRGLEFIRSSSESWNLTSRVVSATDPFFSAEAGKRRAYQTLLGLKWEWQAYLPYSRKWLAIGSLNHHRDALVTQYGITASGELMSGCLAFGLERLALAIFAQHGVDSERWPAAVRSLLSTPG